MRRGFTLVEVLICISMVGLLALPVAWLGARSYTELVSVAARHDAKQVSTRAALRIFAAARGGAQIDPDNHGLHSSDGATLRWQQQRLELSAHGSTQLLLSHLEDFTVTRSGGRLILNFGWSAPAHPGGPPLAIHETYEEPRP